MGIPTPPQPVKLLVALLSADPQLFTTVASQLQQSYGAVDLESEVFPWNTTDYYRKEMGENLLRKFVTFERLISPEELVRIKLATNAVELAVSSPSSSRRVNLDPGYLDASKLVLASTKNQAHRLYLAQGIYAEVTLLYHHGAFHPFLYTYADYRWPQTHAFLRQVRTRYLEQLRKQRTCDVP
ncbi:MAG TPA: DUF4416 family protein [Candidatus Binatia bacterium]|jgi:hypothetical protein|nr:DUF4416 family protein [Candidatus Binatia bacterium]